MGHVDLALVHELNDGVEVDDGSVFEDDDLPADSASGSAGRHVFAALEKPLEVRAAGREHDSVSPDGDSVFGGQNHVGEPLGAQQPRKDTQHVALVVVPSQAILLRTHFFFVDNVAKLKIQFYSFLGKYTLYNRLRLIMPPRD